MSNVGPGDNQFEGLYYCILDFTSLCVKANMEGFTKTFIQLQLASYNGVNTVETSSPVDLLFGMLNLVSDLFRIFSFGTQKAAVTSSFLPRSAYVQITHK